MAYWLMKSEPDELSIEALAAWAKRAGTACATIRRAIFCGP
jgi:predicted RNA-binding protein with PUA-like domain